MKTRTLARMVVALSAVCVVALAVTGCAAGSSGSASASASSAAASSASASAAASSTSASSPAASTSSSATGAQIPNPWSEYASADEAAKAAGVESFNIARGMAISLGAVEPVAYRAMKGLAEVDAKAGTAGMTIRKGLVSDFGSDVSGDYNTYAKNWTQNVKGLDVACVGATEGAAARITWSANNYAYCVLMDGGATLTADDVNSLVNGIH